MEKTQEKPHETTQTEAESIRSTSPDTTMTPLGKPIKTFDIRCTSPYNPKHQVISQDGNPVLWIECTTGWISDLLLTLRVTSSGGAIMACSKISYFYRNCYIASGDVVSGPVNGDPWVKLDRRGTVTGTYAFPHAGKTYAWKRTHDKELTGRKMSYKSFKLVDADDAQGNVLAVLKTDSNWKGTHYTSRLDFYADLEEELEKLALVAVFGTVERIRRIEMTSV